MGKHVGSAQSSAWHGASSQSNMSSISLLATVLVFQAALTTCHRWNGFKQQTCIFSLFRKPEVQRQSVGRVMLLLEMLKRTPSSPFAGFLWLLAVFGGSLACSCISAIFTFTFTWPFYVCSSMYLQISLSLQGHQSWIWSPTLPHPV